MVITEEASKKIHTGILGCRLLARKLSCLEIPESGRMQGRERVFPHNLRWRFMTSSFARYPTRHLSILPLFLSHGRFSSLIIIASHFSKKDVLVQECGFSLVCRKDGGGESPHLYVVLFGTLKKKSSRRLRDL